MEYADLTWDLFSYIPQSFGLLLEAQMALTRSLCSGWQIAPAELEDVLLTHPAVADVGVVGVDAPQAGLQILP